MRSLYQDVWLIIIDKIEGIYQVESWSFVQCILSGARGEIGAAVVLSFEVARINPTASYCE